MTRNMFMVVPLFLLISVPVPRAWLSRELFENRFRADREQFVSLKATHREWFSKIKDHFKDNVLQYSNEYGR